MLSNPPQSMACCVLSTAMVLAKHTGAPAPMGTRRVGLLMLLMLHILTSNLSMSLWRRGGALRMLTTITWTSMIWADLLCGWPSGRGRPAEQDVADAAKSSALADRKAATSDLCIFCNPTPDKFNIILESDNYIVFADRSPAARHHLLAVPRAHIPNVKSLSGQRGAQTVQELQMIGRRALEIVSRGDTMRNADPFADESKKDEQATAEPRETRFGFHIPPFRSVDHLHLHCLALPFASPIKALKYRIALGDGTSQAPHKGWGWFVSAEQTMAILRDGGEVGVKPC